MLRLTAVIEGDAVTCDGRLFQRRAEATGKARPPIVERRTLGTTSLIVDA
jgi:hypothetical protein